MTRLVVLSAGLSAPSSTRLLADRLSEATVRQAEGPVELEVIELRRLAYPLAERMTTGFAGPELDSALESVRRADALIAVTPVFAASYSGLFKMFLDVLDRDALAGTPVLIAATGGTARHSMVLEHALRPVFSHLRAVVVPTGVYAATDDFGETGLDSRVVVAGAELAALVGGSGDRRAPRRVRERTVEEELVEPTPFEDLVRRAGSGVG